MINVRPIIQKMIHFSWGPPRSLNTINFDASLGQAIHIFENKDFTDLL